MFSINPRKGPAGTKMLFAKLGAVVLVGLASVQPARAQQSSFTQVQIFGTAGLTAGQTMRLNVVNPGVLLPSKPTLSCQLQLVFVNPSGMALKTENVTVAPGQSASAELNRDLEIAAGDGSVPVRAMVRNLQVIIEPSGVVPPDSSFCPIVPSVEIVDNATNKTQVIVTDAKTFTTIPGVATAGGQR
jgi:hypothetical protein